MDVFDLGSELAALDEAATRIAEHRNDVSRAAAGAVGSQQEGPLRSKARSLSETVTLLESAVMWGRRALEGTATAAAQGAVPLAVGEAAKGSAGVGINATSGMTAPADDATFSVTVSDDAGDAFSHIYLNVRPSSLVNDLVRAALERLSLQHAAGIWALHLRGNALVGENTAAEAGLAPGDELVLLRVAE